MISKLTGTIDSIDDKKVILDVQGIGYRIYTTGDTLHALSSKIGIQEKVSLHIHSVIREDAFDLYGFTSAHELHIFELLISVSGIGPKTALGVLSVISAENLQKALQHEDVSALTKVAGIGKKIAEKIIVELKDKIDTIGSYAHIENNTPNTHSDAIDALTALGYSLPDARNALKKIDPNLETTASKVRAALKLLS